MATDRSVAKPPPPERTTLLTVAAAIGFLFASAIVALWWMRLRAMTCAAHDWVRDDSWRAWWWDVVCVWLGLVPHVLFAIGVVALIVVIWGLARIELAKEASRTQRVRAGYREMRRRHPQSSATALLLGAVILAFLVWLGLAGPFNFHFIR